VLLAPADKVTFRPIPRAEFEALEAAAMAGNWQLPPEGAAA
jgi:hypothetical protein